MAIDFWRFKRLGKLRQQYIIDQLSNVLFEYHKTYTKKQIKHWWRKDSLSHQMGIYGHNIERPWDLNDIHYRAGQIVEFCNHIFNDHTYHKLETYQIMEQMNIYFDLLMLIDYKRAKWRALKYSTLYERDNNIEKRVTDKLKSDCNYHKKELILSGCISLFLAVFCIQRLFQRES